MARPVFADPKTDFVFKRLFGSEEHKPLLLALLNDLLELDSGRRIVEVTLLPPEQRPPVPELKLSIVDVVCVDERGVRYVVEMQVLQVEGFEKRVVYNVAKAYVAQLGAGRPYPELDDVVGVTICDFELWPHAEGFDVPMLSRWRMQEQHTGERALPQLQLVFLELPKLDATRPPQSLVEKWAYFFREASNLSVIPDALREPPLLDAFEAARAGRFTEEEWDAVLRSLIAIQDERGALSFALKRGHARGLARGLERGREEGLARGREEGLARGRDEGRAEAKRGAVVALCEVLGIELDEARRAWLSAAEGAALDALFDAVRTTRRWPSTDA